MYVLKLKDGVKSYRGAVFATHEQPECQTANKELAESLQATGYFDLLREYAFSTSLFGRDPSMTGGVNCDVKMHQFRAEVTGMVEWYDADEALSRPEGCRVGFVIEAPEDLSDVEGATYTYNGQTGLVVEDIGKDPRRLYWYPLVEEGITERSIVVDWNPGGERQAETFTVSFKDCQLQPKPQTEENKLSVQLDSMTLKELKEYAKEEGINLGGATSKVDIIQVIMAVKFPKE